MKALQIVIVTLMVLLPVGFVTGCPPGGNSDDTAPTVSSTTPGNGATDVAISGKIIATFSETIARSTVNSATFRVTGPGTSLVSGSVSLAAAGTIAVFTPASDLASNTLFTATIKTTVKDLAGNALADNFVWTFTTGATEDTTAPTVSSTDPVDTAANVAVNGNVSVTFSEAMDPATITATRFHVTGPGTTPVIGVVSIVGSTAVFTPASNLAGSTTFTATVTTGAKDLSGNALAADSVWTFTTGTEVAAGPAPVVLGTAGDFAILAKSGISSVPISAVTGDIGVSPIDSTAITGFSLSLDASTQFSTSTQVIGSVYAADYSAPTPANLTTAIGNMETAYTDAAGRAADVTELGAGNIGGLTLAPGVYQWGTDVTIPTDVTLSGGANDVWIFQIAGNLTIASAKSVLLSGGALPKNIFWQVAGGAGVSLGAGAQLEGIVLTQTEINVGSTASVHGRLLAQTAVNISGSTITQPTP